MFQRTPGPSRPLLPAAEGARFCVPWKVLRALDSTWSTMEFEHEPHPRTGTMMLKSDEVLVETLEDNQVQLQNLMMSKYLSHFLKEVTSWQQKLSTADSVISVWFEVQRTWSHLESIFIGSEDIRAQLPEASRRFDGVDLQFKASTAFSLLPGFCGKGSAEKTRLLTPCGAGGSHLFPGPDGGGGENSQRGGGHQQTRPLRQSRESEEEVGPHACPGERRPGCRDLSHQPAPRPLPGPGQSKPPFLGARAPGHRVPRRPRGVCPASEERRRRVRSEGLNETGCEPGVSGAVSPARTGWAGLGWRRPSQDWASTAPFPAPS